MGRQWKHHNGAMRSRGCGDEVVLVLSTTTTSATGDMASCDT